MTPQDFIIAKIAKYPDMYAGMDSNLNTASLKILDQLLNVLGNGIDNDRELAEALRKTDVVDEDVSRYFEQNAYYGFIDTIDFEMESGEVVSVPKPDSKRIVCLEEEKELHPEVGFWLDCGNGYSFNPYPNFSKRSSTIYQCPTFLSLGDDWLQAAISFYEKCKKWIEENESKYYRAFPKSSEAETDKALEDFKNYNAKYDTAKQISKAHGLDGYTGNDYEYLCRVWGKERERIFTFIDDTVAMLKDNLSEKGSM